MQCGAHGNICNGWKSVSEGVVQVSKSVQKEMQQMQAQTNSWEMFSEKLKTIEQQDLRTQRPGGECLPARDALKIECGRIGCAVKLDFRARDNCHLLKANFYSFTEFLYSPSYSKGTLNKALF